MTQQQGITPSPPPGVVGEQYVGPLLAMEKSSIVSAADSLKAKHSAICILVRAAYSTVDLTSIFIE